MKVIKIDFTNILASALQEYQTGIPVPDNVEPQQVYKDLAWKGLEGTFSNPNPIFLLEYPLGSPAHDRYDAVNAAEDHQLSSNQIAPVSTPCN